MGSITNDPIQQLIDVETQLIIDLGRALRDAARIGPAGDLTSIQEMMKEKLPEADRRWQHSLNELEMQILDAKAVLTRDLERIRPKGSVSATHNYLKGSSTPVFTTPAPAPVPPKPTPVTATTSALPQPTPVPTPVPTPTPFKNTPVPPPVIPPGAIPSAPSSVSTPNIVPETSTGSASVAPIPLPAASRSSASPLLMKKETSSSGPSGRGAKASPAISKAGPGKKASPALTKAQLAKTFNKSPNKKNSPAVSKASPAVGKASPAIGKTAPTLGKSSPALAKSSPAIGKSSPAVSKVTLTGKGSATAGRKNSPAPVPEMGFTNIGFGLAEQKQTPVPPPQIPPAAGKPKQAPKKKATVVANKKSTAATSTTTATATATTTTSTPVISAPPAPSDSKVSFAPADSSGDIFIGDAPPLPMQNGKGHNGNGTPKGNMGSAPMPPSVGIQATMGGAPQAPMSMDIPMTGTDLMGMGFAGEGGGNEFADMYMDPGDDDVEIHHDMADFNDEFFSLN